MSKAALTAPTALDAFLAWEAAQPQRYELLDGIVTAMVGGTIRHAAIARNLTMALHGRLRGRGCAAYQSDVKVVTPSQAVLYPDVLVHCGRPDGQATSISDPILVAEVLSRRTMARDLDWKRWAYQSMPSLRHMLFIVQKEPIVEIFSLDPDGATWRSVMLRDLHHTLRLEALGIDLPLTEIYAGVLEAGDHG